MPPLSTSRNALSAFKAGYRSTSALSTRSFVPRTFLGGNHGTQSRRDPVSRTPFPSPAVPSEGPPSTTKGADMPQKSNSDRTDLGLPDRYRDDWGQSTYKIDPEAFRQPISFATPADWDRSSTLTTPPNLGLHDANLDSQESAIPPSDKAPPSLTKKFSEGDRASTTTVVPHSSQTSRGFKRLGTRTFGELHEKYPPSQSR